MSEASIPQSGRWRKRLQRLRRSVRSALPFVSGILATLVALLLYTIFAPHPHQVTTREINDTVAQALASATAPSAYSARVYEAIHPSLVLIQTKAANAEAKDTESLGSGVVIDAAGDILTSLHVVANATEIELTFTKHDH